MLILCLSTYVAERTALDPEKNNAMGFNDGNEPAATRNTGNSSHPSPAADEAVPGSVQHCLLTTESPMTWVQLSAS